MATQLSTLVPLVRTHLIETTAAFWTDQELQSWLILGVRDLWRSLTDLKQEYFAIIDNTNVFLPTNAQVQTVGYTALSGVPANVHKIFFIEPKSTGANSANVGLQFSPLKWNDELFQLARTQDPLFPQNETLYYAIHGENSPVRPPDILVAPQVTQQVQLSFSYIPTLGAIEPSDNNPIPGESDQALIDWTVAYARAKERDDRMPDPGWIQLYEGEKQKITQSLGIRQYQEPQYAKAEFEQYWG